MDQERLLADPALLRRFRRAAGADDRPAVLHSREDRFAQRHCIEDRGHRIDRAEIHSARQDIAGPQGVGPPFIVPAGLGDHPVPGFGGELHREGSDAAARAGDEQIAPLRRVEQLKPLARGHRVQRDRGGSLVVKSVGKRHEPLSREGDRLGVGPDRTFGLVPLDHPDHAVAGLELLDVLPRGGDLAGQVPAEHEGRIGRSDPSGALPGSKVRRVDVRRANAYDDLARSRFRIGALGALQHVRPSELGHLHNPHASLSRRRSGGERPAP